MMVSTWSLLMAYFGVLLLYGNYTMCNLALHQIHCASKSGRHTSVPPDLHTPMAVIHVSVRPATSTCEPRI